jgi:hypothetical protein
MSHLRVPRIHFRGEFSANAYTANNDDYGNPPFVDSANVRVDTLGKTDADFATWLRGLDPSFGVRAGWNLYGDGATLMNNAQVHSLQTVPGQAITDPAADKLVGASVQLIQAVMVDLDPKGTLGTQIFCDEFQIQAAGGIALLGKPTRFHTRWVLPRNLSAGGFEGFAAVWHAVVPADQLTVTGTGSATVDLFQQAKTAGQGLFIRFVTYLLFPKISSQQLAADFSHNLTTENPAIGRVLGSVGIWSPAEMTTIPVGRRLVPATTIMSDHASYQLNPATFAVDSSNHVLSLDLINTFPEINETLAKVSLGDVGAYVDVPQANGTSQLQKLGPVAYDRASYEQTGGMIDVPISAPLEAAVASGEIVLVQESSGNRLMDEADQTVETDDRCVYLDEKQAGTLHLRVLRKGASPGAPVTIRLAQFITSQKSFTPATPANAVLTLPDQVVTDANGLASVPLATARPGTCVVTFLLPDSSDGDMTAFANVRVLPEDDYSHVTDDQLTFPFIYNEVLRYYYLLYPNMNKKIDLSVESKVTFRAQFIRDRIDASRLELSPYMPRTRELSAGKRKLLQRWCDKVLAT